MEAGKVNCLCIRVNGVSYFPFHEINVLNSFTDILERVHWRTTNMMKALLWEKAERFVAVQAGEQEGSENLTNIYKYLKEGWKKYGARLCSVEPSARTRGSSHRLKHRILCMNMRKHFFTVQMTEHGNRLHRVVAEPSSLEIFENHPDVVLGSLLWVALLEQGSDQTDPESPASLSHPVVLWR